MVVKEGEGDEEEVEVVVEDALLVMGGTTYKVEALSRMKISFWKLCTFNKEGKVLAGVGGGVEVDPWVSLVEF